MTSADAPDLAGTVVDVDQRWIALLLDRPTPGTDFPVVVVIGSGSSSPAADAVSSVRSGGARVGTGEPVAGYDIGAMNQRVVESGIT